MAQVVPRDYQMGATAAWWSHIHNTPNRNPLLLLPTGLGKSLVGAMCTWQLLDAYPHLRIMHLTHVKELIAGNYRALKSLWPAAPAGIYSAGLNERDTRSQIIYAGIGSVAKRPATFGKVDFVFIDEAHMVSDEESAQYVKFITALRARNPNLIVTGLTATGFRMKMGMLTDGEMFDDVCFDMSSGDNFVWAINQGYLIRPVTLETGLSLDSSKVKITAGEFANADASAAMHEQNIIERAVDITIRLGVEQNRREWLTFAQSIEDAEMIADMFTYKGYPHAAVHSERKDGDEVLEAFRKGEYRGVVNMGRLTTGYDQPGIDLLCFLRLTRSPGLWVQMNGRGTRPSWVGHIGHNGGPPLYDINTLEGRKASILASHKQTCLVLDFCGNLERLGPINYPQLPKKRGQGGGEAPVRTCPACGAKHHVSVTVCTECGYEFPPPERVQLEASTSEIVIDLSNLPMPEPKKFDIFGVNRMVCSVNKGKKGKLDTMRVDYFCGVNRFSTWISILHAEGSFPLRKAQEWWAEHGGGKLPDTIEEALEKVSTLRIPKFIRVWTNTTFPEIKEYDFRGTRFELPPEAGGPPLQEPPPDPTEALRNAAYAQTAAIMGAGYFGDDEIPF